MVFDDDGTSTSLSAAAPSAAVTEPTESYATVRKRLIREKMEKKNETWVVLAAPTFGEEIKYLDEDTGLTTYGRYIAVVFEIEGDVFELRAQWKNIHLIPINATYLLACELIEMSSMKHDEDLFTENQTELCNLGFTSRYIFKREFFRDKMSFGLCVNYQTDKNKQSVSIKDLF